MKPCNSIMRGCFCIRFLDFMFKVKSLTVFTNEFLTSGFKKKIKKNKKK